MIGQRSLFSVAEAPGAALELERLPLPALLAELCGAPADTWRKLLADAGGLRALLERYADAAELPAGVRRRAAAAAELARRLVDTPLEQGARFDSSACIWRAYRERLGAADREHLVCVLLDQKHRILCDVLVSVGSMTASIVHPREVLRPIIAHGAAAFVLVHNHPSGDPVPSAEDLEITRRVRGAAELLGVRCLDHVIIGRGRYVSFVDDGYW